LRVGITTVNDGRPGASLAAMTIRCDRSVT
jgi:hypothetical protein